MEDLSTIYFVEQWRSRSRRRRRGRRRRTGESRPGGDSQWRSLGAGGGRGGRTQLQTVVSRWFYSSLLCFSVLSIFPPSLGFCLRLSISVYLCFCSFFFLSPLSFSRHSPLSRSLFSIRLFSLFFFCLSPSFCYCPPPLFFFFLALGFFFCSFTLLSLFLFFQE